MIEIRFAAALSQRPFFDLEPTARAEFGERVPHRAVRYI
ncbi:hypothetical protein EKH55_0355 [Sinorhizobium alkalisoli]|nr:hypothetical protein EKH55_0355 [Sinorhizobium alkalisoli]